MIKSNQIVSAVVGAAFIVLTGIAAGETFREVPSQIDASKKYLFWLHGIAVELIGPDAYSKYFDKTYEHTAIAKTFAERGYVVIADVRPKGARPFDFAKQVAEQIGRLREAGVPASSIGVVGHSKGGFIAELVAALHPDPEIRYVFLGGCPLPGTHDVAGFDARARYDSIVKTTRGRAKGRVLSLYDINDEWMGPCEDYFKTNPNVTSREVVLSTGQPPNRGHGLFYSPDKRWIDPVVEWINQ